MELHELRDELQQENALASEIFGKPESDQLIKGLIGTANEKSTANKVINYTQLTIED
jgi:hypothetical protein